MTRIGNRLSMALLAGVAMAGCATAPMASAQTPPPVLNAPPMSSIQPETTITLTGRGSVDHAPDIALISVGVQVHGETASSAMSQQADKMNGVFAAVRASGVADKDMQTGNLSLNPSYDYPDKKPPRLIGYDASNQINIKVRDLKNLGKTLDAIVKGGGNTINGVSFSIDKPDAFQDEARVEAIKDAAAKAELYAKAVGYKVKRIVTVNETEYYPQPVPMVARMQMKNADAAPTPIAAGEVSLTQTVSVMFELTK
ncbi:MAG TPA: SIMPL domain-containing protein [Hyphomonadaceae bacterium]|nr:SIMPL domain-containing protein [Hyphomonadaceae bacterium]